MARTQGPWYTLHGRIYNETEPVEIAQQIRNEDDAKLIAAAPEMLETLEAARAFIREHHGKTEIGLQIVSVLSKALHG